MDKVVYITGGASGIGAATVRKFVNEGWKVGFSDINDELATKLLNELPVSQAIYCHADTTIRDHVRVAVETITRVWGNLNAVVANAGIHRCNTLLDVSDEELDLMIQTNIYGTINTLKVAVPSIIANGGGTVVINCSDQWFVGKPNSFVYGLTKGALGQMTRSLSIDLGPKNIRVNAVCGGTIRTPLVDKLFQDFARVEGKSMEDYWKQENSLYARGEAGKPEEVANMIYFLSSDQSTFCTGGHYLCDGGLVAR